VIPRYGRPEVLEVREMPDPHPGPGEVRIKVHAAGLNFAETSARQGLYPDAPKPPCVVGYEVAGVVDELGELGDGVSGLSKGDRVWAMTRFGGHAELACTPASLVRRMPASLDFEHAAAIPVVYATAALLISDYGRVLPGERVLIHMAAGGVGVAAIQLCRQIPDVTLFGTASARKHDFLRELGVQHPIDYHTLDYEAEVMRLTDGKGVHVVLDPMGGENWRKGYRLLAPLGRLMIYGFSSVQSEGSRNLLSAGYKVLTAPSFKPMALMGDNKALMGLNLGHLFGEGARVSHGLDHLAKLIDQGVIKPVVDSVIPFAKAADAHRRIESRQNQGKVILVP
jgi:NADPH:quinone reductase-like Zn-dependent oxidoreductase